MKIRKHINNYFGQVIVVSLLLLLPSFSFASTGTIDSTNKYAWGSSIGWVNFNPTNGSVAVTDSALTGDAWSENYGWINLNPTLSGVKNDGTGVLSGYAWGENSGYINFSGVSINSQGVFIGTAVGDVAGTITFGCTNCRVSTTWRQGAVTPPSTSPVGSGGLTSYGSGSSNNNSGATQPSFTINNGVSSTQSSVVTLTTSDTSNVSSLSITNQNAVNTSIPVSISPQAISSWNVCSGLTSCLSGVYSVTINFLDSNRNIINTVSHSISYAPATSVSNPNETTTTTPNSGTQNSSNPTSYNFGTVTLKNGSKGSAVVQLQEFLNATLNLGLVVDGKLGPKTIAVIKKWQKAHGLVADGLVGPKTKAKMNASLK